MVGSQRVSPSQTARIVAPADAEAAGTSDSGICRFFLFGGCFSSLRRTPQTPHPATPLLTRRGGTPAPRADAISLYYRTSDSDSIVVCFLKRLIGLTSQISQRNRTILLVTSIVIGLACLAAAIAFCPPMAALIPFLAHLSLPILIPVCAVTGILFMNMLNQVLGSLYARLPEYSTVSRKAERNMFSCQKPKLYFLKAKVLLSLYLLTGVLSLARAPRAIYFTYKIISMYQRVISMHQQDKAAAKPPANPLGEDLYHGDEFLSAP